MLGNLFLPPGYSVRIELKPSKFPVFATVSAYHNDRWLGELSVAPHILDEPGMLQFVADMLTKRGVRSG